MPDVDPPLGGRQTGTAAVMSPSRDLMPVAPPRGKTGWPWCLTSDDEDQAVPWPSISIITPSLNQGEFIEETIRSVLGQGYPALQYVIQEAGSTDATADVLAKYQGHPYLTICREPDSGQSNGINRGFRRATGEVVTWLNADDIYLPGALFRVGEHFAAHPESQAVVGLCERIDADGAVLGLANLSPSQPLLAPQAAARLITPEKLLHYECVLPQPSVFFRRSLLDRVGYLDESLHYTMDFEFWVRISLGSSIDYLPHVLSQARMHPGAKTAKGVRDGLRTLVPEVLQVMRRYRDAIPSPMGRARGWSAERRFLAHFLWRAAMEANSFGEWRRARGYARRAALTWPFSVNRYDRVAELLKSCLPVGR